MTIIENVVTDSAGTPQAGVLVTATLVTSAATAGRYPGVTATTSVTVAGETETDADGHWQLNLTPNNTILQPTGTYYLIQENYYASNIIVPTAGGPYNLDDVLTTPTTPPPGPTYTLNPPTITIASVRANAGTAPTGQALIADVLINGVSIFTGPSPLSIAGGTHTSGKITAMTTTVIAAGQFFTVDVSQVGSGVAGADVTVQITLVA